MFDIELEQKVIDLVRNYNEGIKYVMLEGMTIPPVLHSVELSCNDNVDLVQLWDCRSHQIALERVKYSLETNFINKQKRD
jgi:hypothetical protein